MQFYIFVNTTRGIFEWRFVVLLKEHNENSALDNLHVSVYYMHIVKIRCPLVIYNKFNILRKVQNRILSTDDSKITQPCYIDSSTKNHIKTI